MAVITSPCGKPANAAKYSDVICGVSAPDVSRPGSRPRFVTLAVGISSGRATVAATRSSACRAGPGSQAVPRRAFPVSAGGPAALLAAVCLHTAASRVSGSRRSSGVMAITASPVWLPRATSPSRSRRLIGIRTRNRPVSRPAAVFHCSTAAAAAANRRSLTVTVPPVADRPGLGTGTAMQYTP